MAAFYRDFVVTRVTEPDPGTLLAQLRALDASAGVQHDFGTPNFTLKKSTAWTSPQITAALNALETAPAATPQLAAQKQVDELPIVTRAILLTLLDQINTIRAALAPPLGAITPAQVIAAVRTKAGTLS